jgi:hypothetical protein
VQPENTKASLKVNGTMTNQEAIIDTDEFQTIVSDHPPEGIVEEVTGWLERYSEAQTSIVGTSSHPSPKKDKN